MDIPHVFFFILTLETLLYGCFHFRLLFLWGFPATTCWLLLILWGVSHHNMLAIVWAFPLQHSHYWMRFPTSACLLLYKLSHFSLLFFLNGYSHFSLLLLHTIGWVFLHQLTHFHSSLLYLVWAFLLCLTLFLVFQFDSNFIR